MEIIVERLPGNIVISKVDALMYVILSMAEKHVLYGELVGTTECVMLRIMHHTNWGHYNQIQLYLYML